jgi:hypothetical protein
MSHISTVNVLITDLSALERAAADCRMVLVRDKHEFTAYYGIQQGVAHCLEQVSPTDTNPYSIGLKVLTPEEVTAQFGEEVARDLQEQGLTAYSPQFDMWANGHGLGERVGRNLGTLIQRYAYHVQMDFAAEYGYSVEEEQMPDGSVKLWMEEPVAAGNW